MGGGGAGSESGGMMGGMFGGGGGESNQMTAADMMKWQMLAQSMQATGSAFDGGGRGAQPSSPGFGTGLQSMLAMQEQTKREEERKKSLQLQAMLFGKPWTNPDNGEVSGGLMTNWLTQR